MCLEGVLITQPGCGLSGCGVVIEIKLEDGLSTLQKPVATQFRR